MIDTDSRVKNGHPRHDLIMHTEEITKLSGDANVRAAEALSPLCCVFILLSSFLLLLPESVISPIRCMIHHSFFNESKYLLENECEEISQMNE